MAVLSGNGDFLTFQRQTLDKSPQDVRVYRTPERKEAAIPTYRAGMGTSVSDMPPDCSNAVPTTYPKQADMSKMPFITGGKLLFTLDGVDYVASGNIFMCKSRSKLQKPITDWKEWQANTLASAILLPACLVRKALRKFDVPDRIRLLSECMIVRCSKSFLLII